MTDKNTLIGWFLRGMKPLAKQYEAWLNSYWHKSEKLPVSSITELETILNNKSDSGHKHEISDTTNLQNALDNKANADHQHDMTDVDGLQDKFSEEHLYFNNAINDEITQRKEADKAIQDEVDSLKRITMIRGNVDTYADLILLDTSTIREGDSYIVEADETREGKSTLYVWSSDNWVYTGEWASGGGTNLGNADLVQTETENRIYTIPSDKYLKFETKSIDGKSRYFIMSQNHAFIYNRYIGIQSWESDVKLQSAKDVNIYATKRIYLKSVVGSNVNVGGIVIHENGIVLEGILSEPSYFTVLVIDGAGSVTGRKLALHTLPDVMISGESNGDVLTWKDNAWVNSPAGGGIGGSELDQRVAYLEQMQINLLEAIQRQEQTIFNLEQTLGDFGRRIDQLENRP